jgi:hypothetical protein
MRDPKGLLSLSVLACPVPPFDEDDKLLSVAEHFPLIDDNSSGAMTSSL